MLAKRIWEASCPKTQTNSRLARRAVSIVIDPWRAPVLGSVGGDVGDSGSPYAQGNTVQQRGATLPGGDLGPGSGPHLDQNVLAGYAAVALALILDLCLLFIHPGAPNLISLRSAGTIPA